MQGTNDIIDGTALNEAGDEWRVECPGCEMTISYRGFFDPEDECVCQCCDTSFKVRRIWIDEENYIGNRGRLETVLGSTLAPPL